MTEILEDLLRLKQDLAEKLVEQPTTITQAQEFGYRSSVIIDTIDELNSIILKGAGQRLLQLKGQLDDLENNR